MIWKNTIEQSNNLLINNDKGLELYTFIVTEIYMARQKELEEKCIRIFLSYPKETYPRILEKKYLFRTQEFRRVIELTQQLKNRYETFDYSLGGEYAVIEIGHSE